MANEKSSNKYVALLRDTMLFALSAYLPKLLSFFLVPVYTSCLTTAEYGIIDLVSTTVSFLVPVMTLGIDNSTLRFTIEDKENKKPYQISLKIVLIGIMVVSFAIVFNNILNIIKVDPIYQGYFWIIYCVKVLHGINAAYLRATDKVALLSATSITHSLLFMLSNIVTLCVFKLGMKGYIFSDIFGILVSNLIIMYKIDMKKVLKGFWKPVKQLEKQMLEYSVPLVASSIAWWVNSASDKYFILYLCGVAANGVYSVAYKIPTILKLLQSVFYQAWILSIYKEYDKENGKQYVSKIYNLYNGAIVMGCSAIILLNIPLSKFLYAKDFFEAWKYVPALLISIVFVANAGFYESILSVFKKSKTLAMTTVIGAVVNTILNFVLIYSIGVQGAAIATAVGYFVMWVTKIPLVHRLYDFRVNWFKHATLIVLLVVQAYVMINYQNYYIGGLIFVILFTLNYKAVVGAMFEIVKKLKKKH